MNIRTRLCFGLLSVVLLCMTACCTSLASDEPGSIPLVPFRDQEAGVQGVVPAGCSHTGAGDFDCPPETVVPGHIAQESLPGKRADLVAVVLEATGLDELPQSTGTLRGANPRRAGTNGPGQAGASPLTWELYELEAQIKDAGPVVYRIALGLAEGDSASYIVAVVTLPDYYDSHRAQYRMVFEHALYAFVPLRPLE